MGIYCNGDGEATFSDNKPTRAELEEWADGTSWSFVIVSGKVVDMYFEGNEAFHADEVRDFVKHFHPDELVSRASTVTSGDTAW